MFKDKGQNLLEIGRGSRFEIKPTVKRKKLVISQP